MIGIKLQSSRPTIGLLTEVGLTPYNNFLWAGFADAASKLDVNLIGYVGGVLNSSQYGYDPQRNILYDLVSSERVDGLLIAGILGNFVTTEEFTSFIDRYRPLPMVGISETPGLPCVVVDNAKGMRDIVTHFVEVHGFSRIAFICGPEGNEEAALRYRAYVDVLAEHDLPLDPDLVTPGAFVYATGKDAIHLLLEERKVELDAVVAANDRMAFGALTALEERGIRVPDDVALGGFDDTQEAAACYPTLTTIRQPVYKLGQAGMEVLLKLLAGEQVPEQKLLPTGCSGPVAVHSAVGPLKRKREPLKEAVVAQREVILSEMAQAVGGSASSSSEWAGRFLDIFLEEILSDSTASKPDDGQVSPKPFLLAMEDILRQAVTVSSQVDDWQEAMSVMRRHLLPYLTNVADLSRVEDLFNQGRVLIGEMAQFNWARHELEETLHTQALGYLSNELAAATEPEQILDAIGHRLPQLGFSTFGLSSYDGQKRPSKWSRLILAYHEGKRIEIVGGERRFLTSRLVPDELFPHEKQFTWAVESLSSGGSQFGYIVFEIGSLKTDLYGALVRQISGALQDSLLLQKYKQAEEALTRQAQELFRSNAELEHFAHVASHDLQEPLRMVRSYVQLLERRYKEQLDEDADEFIHFAVDGAERMQILISDLLQYSRVSTHGRPFAPTACSAALDHALANLKVAIEESGAIVTYDELPEVMADESQLTRLLQNLIGNAIKFHKKDTRPEVHIGVEHADGEWTFSVRDNGIGIDPEDFERIFMIFERLHTQAEYTGTGIGLAVCKKIVERHGGHMWVESEPGRGSTFYFAIPDRGGSAS